MNLNSNTEGSVKLCCSINENIHATAGGEELNFGKHDIEEIWYSDYMKTVRQQMLAGERPEACKVCWQLEDAGIQSSRQSAFAELRDFGVRPVNYQSERPPLPQSLELRLGHFCNLRCNSCWSLSSDRIANERYKIIDKDESLPKWLREEWIEEQLLVEQADWNWWMDPKFDTTIRKLAPGLKRLYLTGGEPTLIKRNIEIMQMILDSGNRDCYVALTTNLTNYNEVFFQTLSCFRNGEFQISIDHVHDKNHYIRYPTQWQHIEENITKIYYHFPQHWKIKHYTVFQTYNYDAIPEILDWVHVHRKYWSEQEQERLYIWSPIMLDHPDYLDVRIIPQPAKDRAIKEMEEYKPPHEVKNVWYEHGIEQALLRLKDNSIPIEKSKYDLQRFREYTDTLDRSRGTVWYNTFHNIAGEVLV